MGLRERERERERNQIQYFLFSNLATVKKTKKYWGGGGGGGGGGVGGSPPKQVCFEVGVGTDCTGYGGKLVTKA